MAHFLITGGAGYIGSVLVPRLLAEQHRVTVIDCFYFGQTTPAQHPALTCIEQDSRHISLTQLKGVDVVIDLAAMSNDPCGETFKTLTWEVNYRARARTARLARKAGVSRYILPSSCSVYGFQPEQVDEQSATNPLTTYARANLKAEQDILPLASESFCVIVLRLATVFGYSPRMRLDLVVNAMTYNAYKHGEIIIHGGGTQYRPLVHIKDVASAMICTAKAPTKIINGEIYNVGTESLNCQINNIAWQVQQQLHKKGRPIQIIHNGPQDLRSYQVSFTKIQAHCSWNSHHKLNKEIQYLIEGLDNKRINIDERCYTLNWYQRIFMATGTRPMKATTLT
ncbi:NAD-dependent epimerase/dehydratase family protein [Alcanivorax jadensis]|uniref:NAD-dependent epimerase/dehydratase family protein n=1 Tax=Alcanivorax jadensis TaxID=64988 RepID=UPI0024098E70|nr:SDR family oxidoreductase [Alcanivorax jadensis]MDF1637858.1 SDR family oxidoreductase [Alcanivorax jadensis]